MPRRLTAALAASLLAASVHAQTRAGGESRLSTTQVGDQHPPACAPPNTLPDVPETDGFTTFGLTLD